MRGLGGGARGRLFLWFGQCLGLSVCRRDGGVALFWPWSIVVRAALSDVLIHCGQSGLVWCRCSCLMWDGFHSTGEHRPRPSCEFLVSGQLLEVRSCCFSLSQGSWGDGEKGSLRTLSSDRLICLWNGKQSCLESKGVGGRQGIWQQGRYQSLDGQVPGALRVSWNWWFWLSTTAMFYSRVVLLSLCSEDVENLV